MCLHLFFSLCFLFAEKQIEERELERRLAFEEFQNQKAEVDQVVAQLRKQDEREHMERQRKQDETRAFIARYLADRDQWKMDQKRKEVFDLKKGKYVE